MFSHVGIVMITWIDTVKHLAQCLGNSKSTVLDQLLCILNRSLAEN